ncbi:tryptophan halogenase family protein [Microbulbifer agarilyticus]|uniref:tryptophan halogenase family protein n=1 Tax=Microbulbifer agarilyticus TaxID=260552 RepID=UPI001CD6BFCA|nr:tryptophan halogenase family protein [Microbulbifer agarilyticus]MCA0899262.1 tryptophan 7-halogenase [Microbulbifer agarilyticus]
MTIDSSEQIKRILIVGGGTAGWLSACHLAKKLASSSPTGVQVTLVESENIPTIGVGEGTVPAIRDSLRYLGISETEFVRECDATFKQGIKFANWVRPPGAPGADYYHHIFDYPDSQFGDLTPYWLQGAADCSYVDAVSVQGAVCDSGLGPKDMTVPEYEGHTSYAYHLDAAKFARLLTRHGVEKLGVKHLLADVQSVLRDECGNISAVKTAAGELLEADLFVDCTGFASLLLGQSLGVKFVDQRDVLFADYALAAQIPYKSKGVPIPSFTISTAQESGWVWDIGLSERRGTGYVYSSDHTSHDRAESVFRSYLGDQKGDLSIRKIPMRVGYRETFWQNNCVAIGLSQGFVEPLEATGILVYDATARMLADTFPANKSVMPIVAKQFNQAVQYSWDCVIDFIKLHYCISGRRDHAFWIDNCDARSIPDSLQEKLALWRFQPPSAYDFPSKFGIFNLANYQYVLYGMEFETTLSAGFSGRYTGMSDAVNRIQEISMFSKQLLGALPEHRVLIERIKKYGLQKI